MILTKNNIKRLLGKIAKYKYSQGPGYIYYYFLINQEIYTTSDDAEFDTLKILDDDVARTALTLDFGDQIPIIKSVPRDVKTEAIKGIFNIKWGNN